VLGSEPDVLCAAPKCCAELHLDVLSGTSDFDLLWKFARRSNGISPQQHYSTSFSSKIEKEKRRKKREKKGKIYE
jgi:hypothetical protein